MKKEIWNRSVTLEEISVDELINAIFEDMEYYLSDDIEDIIEYANTYIEDEVKEITEEEKEAVINGVKKEFEIRRKDAINDEVETLKDRKHIIQWIDNIIYDYYEDKNVDIGEPGYILTSEEILDLILKNGKK